MSRNAVVCLVIALAASCSGPLPPTTPESPTGFGANDIVAILKLTVEDLDAPWAFRDQDVVFIQVDGYDGNLPGRIHGKNLVRVPDAEATVLASPGHTALHLKISFDSDDSVRVVARETWGTGQSWRDVAAARGVGGWTITQFFGGGYYF